MSPVRCLLLLVGAVAVSLVLLGAGMLRQSYETGRSHAEAQLVSQARDMARLVDRAFDRAEGVALALTASSALARGDLGAFDAELRAAGNLLSADLPPGADSVKLSLLDARGIRLLDTALPGRQGAGARGLPHALAAIASGRPEISDLVAGVASGKPVIALAVPILSHEPASPARRHRVVGAIGVTVPRARLLDAVAGAGLPPGTASAVLDRKGTIVARSFRDAETLGKPPVPAVAAAMNGGESGLAPRGTRTPEGVASVVAFARAPHSGYAVSLEVPEEAFLAPLRASLLRAALGGGLVLVAGLGTVLLAVRRVVVALALRAALPDGAVPAPTGLREADTSAASLAAAVAARDAEAARRESEAFARSILAATSDCVVVLDAEGRVAFINEPGRCQKEIDDVAQVIGRKVDDLWPEESAPLVRAALAQARGGQPARYTAFGPTAKGTPKWWDVTVTPLPGTNGGPVYLLSVARDVTEARRFGDALAQSEAFLRSVLASTTDCVEVIDHAGRLEFMNASGLSLMEIDDFRTIQGREWVGLWPASEQARMREAIAAARAGRANRLEAFCPNVKGVPKWWDVVVAPVREEAGHPVRIVAVSRDVTARREAEEALRRSEATLGAVLEALPVGVTIADAKGRMVRDNAASRELWGVSPETTGWEQYGAWVGWHPATGERIGAEEWALSRALLRGEVTRGELVECQRFGTGERRFFINNAAPVRDAEGRIIAAVAAELDVTEARRIAQALEGSEARLRRAQEAGQIHAFEIGPDAVAQCDDGLRRLHGLPPGARFDYAAWISRVHPDDRARAAKFARLGRAGGTLEIELRVRATDGAVRWVQYRGEAVAGEDGNPSRVSGVAIDITGRKRSEAALQESEARFRAITEAMPQMVWSVRPDGTHDFFNQRWYELTGTTPEQAMGAGWDTVFPEDRAPAQARWHRSLRTGEPYEAEYRLRMADGNHRWVLCRALPVRGAPDAAHPEGRILRWFGTCTDIEEIVEARDVLVRGRAEMEALAQERMRDLQSIQTRLAQAQRMEALGQLAGGMAHDFNNVLQAVQGGAALIARRPVAQDAHRSAEQEDVQRLARMVLAAAERGSTITHRLLAFARRSDLQSDALDPAMLLGGVSDLLAHTLGTGIGVRVEAPPGLPLLFADKGQLETVLVNLAVNARDAMAAGGTVTLAAVAEAVRHAPGCDDPTALRPGDYVRLSVCDTGAGMPPEVLARVTEPFFTTKPAGKGTGLGLAMARGFVEQSGGALHIESAPGQGTTVTLWLPVAVAPPAAPPSAADDAPEAGATTRARLLVVDDDMLVREILKEQLEAAGYAVEAAADGERAVALLEAGAAVDLIVSDVSMPGMDGLAVARAAQLLRPGLPVILLTGFAANAAEIAVDGAARGAFSLLHKPITTRQLVTRVESLLEALPAS